MKAIVFDEVGVPEEVLRVADIQRPLITTGTVLVGVTARPIQPADLAFVRGQYRIQPIFQQTAGLEGFGVVVQAASDSNIKPGTRVAFRCPGTWAEFAIVPKARLIEVPPDIPDELACQMSLNPVTAWALLQESGAAPGDWILVTAAASTVSNIVGAMARYRGIHVIGLVRGSATEELQRCNADHVLSTSRPSLLADIAAIAGDRGIRALLDSVGGPLTGGLFDTLSAGARIIAYGVQDRAPAAVTNSIMIYSNLTWMGFGIDHWLDRLGPSQSSEMYRDLWSMVRDGTFHLPIASTHGLDAIGAALRADATGGRKGKVLLVSR